MKIEPRTLKVIKKYLLKKHTPILYLERGWILIPSRLKDGIKFIAAFKTPELETGVSDDYIVCPPDVIQSELEIKLNPSGAIWIKCSNGAKFMSENHQVDSVENEEFMRVWLMFRKYTGVRYQPESMIPSYAVRAADSVAARFMKCCNISEWDHLWTEQDGTLRCDISDKENRFAFAVWMD